MLTRLPIRVLAPLLFGIPVLVVGLWLSTKWNRQSQQAVAELAEQNIEQIHNAIATKISDVLSVPVRVCEVNEHLVESGALEVDDLSAWRESFVEESKAFDMLSAIAWGGPDGRSAWVSRYADGSFYWALKSDGNSSTMEEWQLDSQGQPITDSKNSFDFDVTTRPWFQAPRDAKQATWSEPYVWVGGEDSQGTTLGISYGIPLYDDSDQLLGIVDADYSLNDLSTYLGKLKVGKTGVAMLLSPDGRLLATSSDARIVSDKGERLTTSDSANPLVATAGNRATGGSMEQNEPNRFEQDGETYYIRSSKVGGDVGLDWTLLTIVPESDFTASIEAAFARSWVTSLLAVAAAVVLGLLAARWLVDPLTRLVTAVRRIGQGDLDTRIDIRHAPEYSNLASEINKMAEGLQDRIRMQRSLSLAMEVQRNLLPAEAPEMRQLDIAGHSTYCDETGGDYYDFLDVSGTDEDTAVLVIGDVMGHGVAAALLMATARGILRSRCAESGSLADFLTHLNDMLVVDTNGERFMTMLLMTISGGRDQLRWASAGHGPPVVYDPTTGTFPELDGGGLPLGLMEGEHYTEYTQNDIRPGAILLASTDGLEEAMNESGEQYGVERARDVIRANATKSAEEISQAIRQSLATHRGGASQDDDLTFVVAKVL
ncbi:SpoIIE family protein phosphatase [Aeoliella sp.]|uniref:SpoIIE family protein phosphatase n=1 Tax=Aeoliella sp. TaxID=2795800 RepID=UPI003CCBB7C4